MKFLGYIKRYDSNVSFSKNLDSYRTGERLNNEYLESIIQYLKNGSLIWTWMEHWVDDESQSIGGATYYTDGEWVWPLYFIHYLEKYKDLKIDKEFINYVESKNGIHKHLSENELDLLSDIYYNDLEKSYNLM